MSARPTVSVYSAENENEVAATVPLPEVFTAPIRPDVVNFVHTNMAKNHRQAYAVMFQAGHLCSAESWGTGRAVSRIPRCQGGGTSRSGSGAFGNMCRGGRNFGSTKVWRKWNRKINQNQRRFAAASALAASALPALVMARGHRIDQVPELPLVLSSSLESTQKTVQALKILERFGASADVDRCSASRKIRAGVGKMRNRRHVMKRGPLIIYDEKNGLDKAFRNLAGVDTASVNSLNLLQLAPGGHLGRFCIWSQGAFEKLDDIFASKSGFNMPRAPMANTDVARIINSDEIQSVVRPAKKGAKYHLRKKNPLKNRGFEDKLNPYAKIARETEQKLEKSRKASKAKNLKAKRKDSAKRAPARKAFYEQMIKD